MPSSTLPDFASWISECRAAWEHRRGGLLNRLGLIRCPTGHEDIVAGRLQPHYELLAARGRVVWGALVQANYQLFQPGDEDLPGVIAYSPDAYFDARPQDLCSLAQACASLKNTAPVDAALQPVAWRLTDEFDTNARLPLPASLTEGRTAYLGATAFHRPRLPNRTLSASALPIVIAPEATELNMILPTKYWAPALRQGWSGLSALLDQAPVGIGALRIAATAPKRQVRRWGPEWDTQQTPVFVTPAMVTFIDELCREHHIPKRPMFFVQLLPDGGKTGNFIDTYDPQIQAAYASNGVTVVLLQDQIETFRGAVIDYKKSTFESGIVIRLAEAFRID